MLHQETNEYGVITVDNAFLNQLIKESLKPYEGKVWKANYKGGSHDFMIKLGNYDSLSEMDLKETEAGVYIRIYLLVKFGVSMGTVAKALIDNISDSLENDFDLKIDNIEIVITGIIMKKGIAKRNVVYKYKHDED